ncbi:MAG: hypothetical protein EOO74_06160 [Myxococcales bacterium]|nr:MAG: hypothetical protein EOO74_06160 [Myxococcales bacterium]
MLRLGTRTILPLAVVLLAALLVPAPAQAADARWRGVITFDKNQKNPHNSEIRWHLYRVVNGKFTLKETAKWRAGSGMGGKRGRNACVRNVGWLPNGTYRIKHHRNYWGNFIKGRAFQLDDKRCSNGTRRQALFIQTEQGDRNRQCRDRRGDQVCRWEFPKFNDYKSAGCIKMSPGDLRALSNRYLDVFRSGVHYRKYKVVLRVIS